MDDRGMRVSCSRSTPVFKALRFPFLIFIFTLYAYAQEESAVNVHSEQVIQVNEQAPIQVYSVPLSPQEKLSQARRRAEQHTEDKIRTRLETMRLREEQERLNKILTPLGDEHVAAPAPLVSNEQTHSYHSKNKASSFFIQLGVGKLYYFLNSYPRLSYQNFQGSNNYMQILSAGLGVYFSRISLEYSPYYNTYRLFYPTDVYNNIKLYSHELAAKFYFNVQSGSIRPFIGVLAAFQTRTYQTDIDTWNERVARFSTYRGLTKNIFTWRGRQSQTLQAGMTAGLEAHLNSHLIIGGEVRGFTNMYDLKDRWNQQQVSYYYQVFPNSPAPEEWSWYRLQFYARYLF